MAARHLLLVSTSLSSVFLFAGTVWGWVPLLQVLLKEGYYAKLCPPGSTGTCVEQEAALNKVFTIACATSLLVSLPAGVLVDKYGPLIGTVVGGTFTTMGFAGVAVSGDHDLEYSDRLLCISLVLVADAGFLLLLSAFPMPFVIPRHATVLTSLCNCLYDASSIVFALFLFVYEAYPHFQNLFTILTVVCFVNTVLLVASWILCREDFKESRGSHGAMPRTPRSGLKLLPVKQQVCTWEYTALVLFALVESFRCNVYLGSVSLVNAWIAGRTGAGQAELARNLALTFLIIPQGWILAPVFASCVRWFGIFSTMQVTVILGVTCNLVQLTAGLEMQVLGTIFFAAFRAFVYSSVAQYIVEVFGTAHLSTLLGICYVATAAPNLFQEPLVRQCLKQANFHPLLAISMAASIIPALATGAAAWRLRKPAAGNSTPAGSPVAKVANPFGDEGQAQEPGDEGSLEATIALERPKSVSLR